MKLILTATVALFLTSPSFGQAWKQDIQRVLDAQVQAWNVADLERFMEGYWESEKLTFYSGGEPQQGYQAALDRYRRRYQGEGREMGRLEFSNLSFEALADDVVLVKGRYQLEMSTGQPSGLFTLIFRRLEKGWKIVHDHTSSG